MYLKCNCVSNDVSVRCDTCQLSCGAACFKPCVERYDMLLLGGPHSIVHCSGIFGPHGYG